MINILAVAGEFPSYFVAVYVVGFLAAVTIGSIAWYNSTKPTGWEGAERPDIVPKLDLEAENTEEDKK